MKSVKFIKTNKGIDCCDNCKFYSVTLGAWKDSENVITQSGGQCRVNPPTIDMNDGGGVWPYVNGDSWCGKFEKK